MAAYKYGSVVIFNGREREKEVLKLCQEFCTEPTKQNYTEGKLCTALQCDTLKQHPQKVHTHVSTAFIQLNICSYQLYCLP